MENRIKPVASLGCRYTYAHVVKRCTRVFLELLLYVYVHVGSLLVSGWWWSRRAARGRMVGRTGSQGRVESLLEPWGESACAGDSLFVRVARRKKESRGRECERERERCRSWGASKVKRDSNGSRYGSQRDSPILRLLLYVYLLGELFLALGCSQLRVMKHDSRADFVDRQILKFWILIHLNF